jgi:hypothetical protein
MKINLISTTIPYNDSHSNIWWPCPELEWVKLKGGDTITEPITVITDELCLNPAVEKIPGMKIGWLIEPPCIKPASYNIELWKEIQQFYTYIFTYDEELIKFNPIKFKLLRFGAVWISPENCKVYPKNKVVGGVVHGGLPISMVASHKTWAPGHKLRHEIMDKGWGLGANPSKWIDFYGTGTANVIGGKGEFPHTKEGRLLPFKDYQFSIVIENMQAKDYFTDKLLDCFACGTIPIYWGAPNISDIFNGVIEFQTIDQLEHILNTLPDYSSYLGTTLQNNENIAQYASPDRNLYKELKKLKVV